MQLLLRLGNGRQRAARNDPCRRAGEVNHPSFFGYPAYGLGDLASPLSADQKSRLLRAAVDAYEATSGNDAFRWAIFEAMTLALCRIYAKASRYEEAADVIQQAIVRAPGSVLLKGAKHALALKAAGADVHPRLEKFLGDDNDYLKQFVCTLPFERFDIGPDGTVLLCCGHWMPTSVGNFMDQSVEGVLNSRVALDIRKSVTDGTYKYCNHVDCGAMVRDTLTRVENAPEVIRTAMETKDFRLDHPSEVMFAFDQTCNLSCPSCRTERIVEKPSQSTAKARAVEDKFAPLLAKAKILHINPAGELFASKPSRKVLEMISDEAAPDVKLAIISNGTLFSEQEWNKYPGIHNRVQSIRISIDAATKVTFEKLRRLGRYEPFIENMRFLRHLRMTVVPQLKFSFTYQIENFREMPAFVDFCEEMHADYAIFERLQNIAYTLADYLERAVHRPEHRLYGEFIEVINTPKMSDARCWHDFDYPGDLAPKFYPDLSSFGRLDVPIRAVVAAGAGAELSA
ncbi:SPASM domain-containing protein [Bradyrhizobium sp. SZCCHNS1050]|uniref:SPASM domain-containing protein n=2 Tax=unclassified Bradyrhizobium TaxID=2631580 RepID=UPI00291649FC|nr:SPASM domain-containing protein [Bradyrhizobium sp. SZCCHNS1050]